MKIIKDREDEVDEDIGDEVVEDIVEEETHRESHVSGSIRWVIMPCHIQIGC